MWDIRKGNIYVECIKAKVCGVLEFDYGAFLHDGLVRFYERGGAYIAFKPFPNSEAFDAALVKNGKCIHIRATQVRLHQADMRIVISDSGLSKFRKPARIQKHKKQMQPNKRMCLDVLKQPAKVNNDG